MSSWEYVNQIEDMTEGELAKRINEVMQVDIKDKINLIPYLGGAIETVEYHYPEMTAKCPMTGARDFYELVIKFQPQKALPELKSLKQYFCCYNDLPISHEHLAAKVYKEFEEAVKPVKMGLVLDTAVRGGIKTIVRLGEDL